MIVGIGVDVCSIERMSAALARRPGLAEKLFTPAELSRCGSRLSDASLAARFAAKEALAKALGADEPMHWHDCSVHTDDHGRPSFEVRGTVAAVATALGVDHIHLSLSHDGDAACAFVVCESLGP